MPELFRHQDTFFGCLSVQRLEPPAFDAETSAAFTALGEALWHRVGAEHVLLATRGFDLGFSERCPALDDARRCSLHGGGKPAICRVVPLDALLPDRAQHLVLASREVQAQYFDSDCIEPGVRPGFDVITRRLSVVNSEASAALALRRNDLAAERRSWGDAVFRMFARELFASPAALDRVPRAGFMTLSIAPVLLVLAAQSRELRARCGAYLQAQAALAARLLEDAAARGFSGRDSTRTLAAFARTNARLLTELKAAP